MSKRVNVRIAGFERIATVEVDETATAATVLEKAGCPADFELFPGINQLPFGRDEAIYDRIVDGGRILAVPQMNID